MNSYGKKRERDLDDSLISWKRLAKPQADQYDSLVALEFAHRNGYTRTEISEEPSFFDGQVALRNIFILLASYCIPAAPDHQSIEKACNLLRLEPTIFTQFQLLIESVSPFINTKDLHNCSLSNHGAFGKIAATVDDPVAFAEALVHEIAHHKLRAL